MPGGRTHRAFAPSDTAVHNGTPQVFNMVMK